MYTAGDLTEDYTSGQDYTREILDPEGIVICYVVESHYGGNERTFQPTESTKALLSHLNRG